MADKVIVSNRGALKAKYGPRLKLIEAAVKRLAAADKARGIATRLVYLDDAAAMHKLGATPVTNATDPRQNKVAIDGVYKGLDAPDYVMILGSVDVVPHQDLKNPAFSPGDDDDQFAPGDVPYASEKPYSQLPEDFVSVTRVVGRVPDLTGGSDPAFLVGLIDTAAKYTERDVSKYAAHLGVSAEVWKQSTALSLSNIFGGGAKLQLAPPKGPAWGMLLNNLSHFFNCHGSGIDPQFYGQRGAKFPVAHHSARVLGNLPEGVVCAAECCYGAELYDPGLAQGAMPMCCAYLGSKAYGYFGSSTIAYGPAAGNGAADLICQFFLRRVIGGASTGRAALEARQDFIRAMSLIDPVDLKTIAQFSLMGDPSIHPVIAPAPPAGIIAVPKAAGARALAFAAGMGGAVDARRMRLATFGAAIGASASVINSDARTPATANVKKLMAQAMKASSGAPAMKAMLSGGAGLDLSKMNVFTFDVQAPASMGPTARKFSGGAPRVVHLAMSSTRPADAPRPQLTAVVAVQQDKAISTLRVLLSR